MSTLRVFTFSADWDLPTTGPFALKLLAWLNLARIPYEQQFEDDTRKGPRGKNPWIELDGERIGDTEVIIDLLSRRRGVDLDKGLDSNQLAHGHVLRRAFEEHFHQILEWELFVHPAGAAYVDQQVAKKVPPVVRTFISSRLRGHFRKQLFARGIGRHSPETIASKGRADVDSLATHLAGRTFLVAERPTLADVAVFGQLAPMVHWPMATPVATYMKSVAAIASYCERMRALCFDTPARTAA